MCDLSNCDFNEVQPTGLSHTSVDVVNHAIEIADDLMRGFWCLWNRHPDYPLYWSDSEFTATNGCPDDEYDEEFSMFWCTYLIIEAYARAGLTVGGANISASTMLGFFRGSHQYFERDNILASQLQPGDVVFFSNGGTNAGHVAIVHSIGTDSITIIQSNGWTKTMDYTIDASGYVQDYGNQIVLGFGRY